LAAPTIRTDLVTITDAETATGWSRNSSAPYNSGGNIQEAITGDFVIQGSNSWSFVSAGGNNRGAQYDAVTGITLADSDHVYFWQFLGPASGSEVSIGSTDVGSFAGDAGATAWMGTGTATNRIIYGTAGADTYGAGGRNFICYPIKYNSGASTDSDTLVQGSPGAAPRYFGGGFNFLSTSRGPNVACDAIRYGTGIFVTDGDVTTPATFQDVNIFNDSANGRYGVFTGIGGGFELQGKLALGRTVAGASDSCYFVDPGSTISIPDTIHSTSNFSQLLFDGNATTTIDITGMNYTAIGQNNRGVLESVSKVADIDIKQSNIINIGQILLGKSTTVTRTTFKECNRVIQDSATITGCILENTTDTTAIEVTGPDAVGLNLITGCSFTRTDSSHAVDLGTISSSVSRNWDGNVLVGYGTGSTGTFSGATGNGGSAITASVDSGVTLTLNIVNDATTPTVQNTGLGDITIAAAVTVTLSGLLGNSEVKVLENPSPYTSSVASPVNVDAIETVNAVTGTDITYDSSGGDVITISSTTTDFTTLSLTGGDEIRVTNRADDLVIYDIFEVVGTPTTNQINVVDKPNTQIQQPELGFAPTGEEVTVEQIGASFSFSATSGQTLDILVFRVGSESVYVLDFPASTTTIPVTQTDDRNYENP